MSIHQPTTRQVSVGHYLESDADYNDTVENTANHANRPDNVRPGIDLTKEVFVSDRRYHICRGGVPGCPEVLGSVELVPIAIAARRGLKSCEKCEPPKYRIEQKSQPRNASLEDFQ